MIKILIVDDHRLVRAGFRRILEGEQGMRVVGEAANAQEALDFVRTHDVDLILLDIAMPGENGLAVLPRLKQSAPAAQAIILSMYSGEVFMARAIAAGASSYLTKETAAEELVNEIRKIFTTDDRS